VKRWVHFARWSLLALAVGPLCGYVTVLFKRMATVSADALYRTTGTYYFLLPIAGAALVAVLYFFLPAASGEGMPAYVRALGRTGERLTLRVTVAKFFSAGAVLASGGSGGMVGPVARITAGLGQDVGNVFRKLGLEAAVVRRAAICGAAGGISAVLAAPVAGALFAVEILYADGINYEDVFPALLSSGAAFLVVYTRPDYQPFLGELERTGELSLEFLPAMIVVAIAATLFGAFFCRFFTFVHGWMRRRVPRLSMRCLFGAVFVVVTAALFGRTVLGAGTAFIRDVVAGGLPEVTGAATAEINPARIAWILLLLAAGKMLATTFTVGSGLSAGLTYPSVLIGAALGSAGARLAGVPVASNLETQYAFAACGISAVLASVMNIPLTSAILVAELFGINQSVPGIIGSVVAYSLARHVVIYRYE